MTETIKAAIYARVSTEEQATPDKVSLAVQRERAEAYCATQGWQMVEVYEDAGVSGAKADRPALTRLLTDAREGHFQRVVFLKLDRFGRNLRDLLNTTATLDTSGVGIVSVQDSFDTGTPSGRLFFGILGAVAEFERDMIRERSMMGKLRHAENGRYFGGPSPFGYDYDASSATLIINEPEAAIVRYVYSLYINEGLSHEKIAARLNAEGVPTKTGKVAHNSLDGHRRGWTRTHINRLLTNPQYRGEFQWNRRGANGDRKPKEAWVSVPVPAIVSDDEFKAAQQRARANKRESQRPRDKASLYLLSGLIRCQACGGAMITTTQRVTRKGIEHTYRYYLCSGQHNYGKPCRPSERVNAQAVEEAVLGMLADTFSDPDKVLAAVAADAKRRQDDRDHDDEITAMLKRNMDGADAERDRYIELYGRGKITEADLDKRLGVLDDDVAKWREELQRIDERERQDVVVEEIAASAGLIADQIEGILTEMTVEERKALVRRLVERVWLDGDNEVTIDCIIKGLISDRRTVPTHSSGIVRL